MTPLEERIHYTFRNPKLLREALTHPSVGHEAKDRRIDNQRLEFLGDAVLQLVVTEHLYGRFRTEDEGVLTQLRSRLVSRGALQQRATAINLGAHLLLGRGEQATGGRTRSSTLADGFEALIGAIYLDGGLDPAREFILRELREELEEVMAEPVDVNPKGQLQELLQGISSTSPVYESISETGPEHEKTFVVEVSWEGQPLGRGSGRSKKQAEIDAAAHAMDARAWEKAAPLGKITRRRKATVRR